MISIINENDTHLLEQKSNQFLDRLEKEIKNDGISTILDNINTEDLYNYDLIPHIKNNYLTDKNKEKRLIGIKIMTQLIVKKPELKYNLFNLADELLQLTGYKKSDEIRQLSEKCVFTLFSLIEPEIIPVFVENFILGKKAGLSPLSRWQTKVISLKILSKAAEIAPREIESMLIILVPVISRLMWDVKKQVKKQAAETLEDICDAIDNIDLKPFIPKLVDAIADPETVSDCIYSLAGTTFVQTVTASALSITVPLLKRGFNDKKTAIRRKCAVITENMAKLVKNAKMLSHLCPFWLHY